ncbi:MAG: cyclic pyranopterin monophosphate synthase MoaC [Deltaproteobacteria bacterium]|uniref:Cyclic pyranopterin monophosphate synthase n=1 Tax=Candidatus Zymogenus saltonus TaxID=2844893 RepID=A0A9D8KC96_9DELT|nr:cyclic pyranopterin monophosphate synthase MoaC [Candidatus Zymogenus saltonus]
MGLTHVDKDGKAKMVDISEKEITLREAAARGRVLVKLETLEMIKENKIKKGDVLATARIAGIMAAKKTHELIPLTHPIPINEVSVKFELDEERPSVEINVSAKTHSRTGIEMEVITGVVIAAATIYDMIKSVDRTAAITDVCLVRKSGGKSGVFIKED